jgi:hypothetical protein
MTLGGVFLPCPASNDSANIEIPLHSTLLSKTMTSQLCGIQRHAGNEQAKASSIHVHDRLSNGPMFVAFRYRIDLTIVPLDTALRDLGAAVRSPLISTPAIFRR